MAPQIRPANGHLVVHQGDPATLSCDILKGSPTPEITWRRKVRFLLTLKLKYESKYLIDKEGFKINSKML